MPTFQEAGLDGLVIDQRTGVFVPVGTPPGIATRLNTEINKILADEDIKKKFAALGAEIRPMSVAQFTDFVHAESVKYIEVIKDTGTKAD